MKFEWDEEKAARNEVDHEEVSFYDAVEAINDPHAVDFYDEAHSYAEHRFNLIGLSQRGLLFVVFITPSDDTIRVISAWLAGPKEKKIYEQAFLEEDSRG